MKSNKEKQGGECCGLSSKKVTLLVAAIMLGFLIGFVFANSQGTLTGNVARAGCTCADSDNGILVRQSGTTTRCGKAYSDICIGPAEVREYYCGNSGLIETLGIACPAGERCKGGACS